MRPTLADCGQTALEEMQRAVSNGMPFDLVLTDCHMPHMDGFMFVSELKKHPNLARSTIMMLTSADRQGAYERCQQLGIESTLLKPLKQSELLQAICEVFRRVNRRESRPVPAQPTSSAMNTRRLRVLLAEDNEVNQRVAIRMLNKLGHEVVVVGNGQLAIDALQTGEFDVVLMDVQMPVLDGFQTVAAIRKQEKLTGKHQPVFAMTAHAMSGDRQRCLDAGMDDYLSKPISETSLSATLSGVADEKPVVACVTTPDSVASLHESFSSTPLFDLETAVQRVDGDRDFLNELMGIFLKMIPDVMKTLNQHAEQRDLHATGESAHLIKGTISNFCAHQAFAAALRLEQVCRDGKIDDLENAHRDLSYEVDRLIEAMKMR
jgi:CheY-like chemotaxis protein